MVMSDHSPEVFTCPGCGKSVVAGEDYVVALEYEAEPGFTLHEMSNAVAVTAERRFHVEHFRGRLGDRFHVLIDESSSSPSQACSSWSMMRSRRRS
jgi:hypothetical protein